MRDFAHRDYAMWLASHVCTEWPYKNPDGTPNRYALGIPDWLIQEFIDNGAEMFRVYVSRPDKDYVIPCKKAMELCKWWLDLVEQGKAKITNPKFNCNISILEFTEEEITPERRESIKKWEEGVKRYPNWKGKPKKEKKECEHNYINSVSDEYLKCTKCNHAKKKDTSEDQAQV